jgi:hypothetical protein
MMWAQVFSCFRRVRHRCAALFRDNNLVVSKMLDSNGSRYAARSQAKFIADNRPHMFLLGVSGFADMSAIVDERAIYLTVTCFTPEQTLISLSSGVRMND